MAVGKEALTPSIALVGIAHRKAFEAVVEEFTETLAGLPSALAKRRLKAASIHMPSVLECKNEDLKSIAAAAPSEELL